MAIATTDYKNDISKILIVCECGTQHHTATIATHLERDFPHTTCAYLTTTVMFHGLWHRIKHCFDVLFRPHTVCLTEVVMDMDTIKGLSVELAAVVDTVAALESTKKG